MVYITELENSGKQFELEVFDLSGKKILSNKIIYQLNLREFGAGVYTIQLKPNNQPFQNYKVVITD